MSILLLLLLFILHGCAMIPELAKTVDDIATDGVIQVQIDKEAFGKETDISINIEIKNKEEK